jgi:hypothetical protein
MIEPMSPTFLLLFRWFLRRFQKQELSLRAVNGRSSVSVQIRDLGTIAIPFLLEHKNVILVTEEKFYPIRLNHGLFIPGFDLENLSTYLNHVQHLQLSFIPGDDYVSSYALFMKEELRFFETSFRPFDALSKMDATHYIALLFFVPKMLCPSNMINLFSDFNWPEFITLQVVYYAENSKGQTTPHQCKDILLCNYESMKDELKTLLHEFSPAFEGGFRCQISHQDITLPKLTS